MAPLPGLGGSCFAAPEAPPRVCGLCPGWPGGALERVVRARDARALLAPGANVGGPEGNPAPPSFLSLLFLFPQGESGVYLLPPYSTSRCTPRKVLSRASHAEINCREKGRDQRRGLATVRAPPLLHPSSSSVLKRIWG